LLTMSADEARAEFNIIGCLTFPDVLTSEEIADLISRLGNIDDAGMRGALRIHAVDELANSPKLLDLVRPDLAPKARPVRAIYFDKSAEA
jgi:hypothetical protein